MLLSLLSVATSALANDMVSCSINDFPTQVARVWYLADHGPYMVDKVVRVGKDIPFDEIPGAAITYEIMKFDYHLVLGAWYTFPNSKGLPPLMLPLNVLMRRDGAIINATDTKTCEGKRALAVDFFSHLPQEETY